MDGWVTETVRRIWKKSRELDWRLSHPSSPARAMPPWQVPASVNEMIKLVQAYTMCDPLRLSVLYGLARESTEVGGDVVECGVCNGGSAAILGAGIRDFPDRKLWLYDTFEGIPAPSPKDGALAEEHTGEMRGSIEAVSHVLGAVGFPSERTVFRIGGFRDAFDETIPEKVSLLHIDADWYDSVLCALETFFPLMPRGGIIILDDFGHWEGTREAFYDFCITHQVKPLLERVGYTQAFWRRGQMHSRCTSDDYRLGVYRPHFDDC